MQQTTRFLLLSIFPERGKQVKKHSASFLLLIYLNKNDQKKTKIAFLQMAPEFSHYTHDINLIPKALHFHII